MKGVIVHGGLLAVMLIYGYQTWTRDKSAKPTAGTVVMWNRTVADVKTVELQATNSTLRIERRGDGANAYWWGIETKTSKRPAPRPPVDPAVPPAEPPEPPAELTVTDEREFPIGDAFVKQLPDFATMRAVKVVGTIKDEAKKDYGLDDTSKTIAVVFGDGSKTLVVGGQVFGGGDRYVMDVDTTKVFVVSRALVTPLEGGESALKPLDLRNFEPRDAKQIEIAALGKSKAVDRIKIKKPTDNGGDPHAAPAAKGADEMIETWGKGAVADQTAANFIDKVEKVRPTKFDAKVDVATLTPLVALTYRDGKGKQLGTIKLFKRDRPAALATVPADPDAGPVEYFMMTERTRVPARVPALTADRVEQDLATVFPSDAVPGTGAGSGAGSATDTGTGTGSGTATGSGTGSATGAGSAPAPGAGSAPAPITPPGSAPAPVKPPAATPPAATPPATPPAAPGAAAGSAVHVH